MVNIAILGDSLEGIAFIKFLARYINQYDVGFNFSKYHVTYRNNSIEERSMEKETKTINPTRLIIKDKAKGRMHTIFAPGGDRSRAVVKMGIITLARIAKIIIAYFSLNNPLREQFEFFNEVQFLPNEIYIWLLEREKLDVNREDIIEEYISSITNFFNKKKMKIKKIYQINIEFMFEILNNRALQSIFEIIKEEGGTKAQKPVKRHEYIPALIEEDNLKIPNLFNASQKYIFLVGAGVSMNKPSSIPPAQELVTNILKRCSPKGTFEDLKDLQYELVIEYLKKYIDKDLIFMDLFEENLPPNFIHFFLANALINGHDVLTTNFDYLIEKALLTTLNFEPKDFHLRSSKNDIPDIKLIITQNDFIQCKKKNLLKNQNLSFFFKIHGSKKNIITGESIDGTVITSISALIKNKGNSKLFEIESYKKEVIKDLITDRTLVVMGYSGSDEFDISPLLRLFPQLKSLIWIAHSNEDISSIFKVSPIADPATTQTRENKLLVEISNSVWYEVVKLNINTERLCGILWGLFFPHTKIPYISKEVQIDLKSWFSSKYSDIEEFAKYEWVVQLYYDKGKYKDALNVVRDGLDLARKSNNKIWKTKFSNQIGLIYIKLQFYDQALRIFTKELEDIMPQKNPEKLSEIFKNLGLAYMHQKKFNEALTYYEKAKKIDKNLRNYRRLSQSYNNIGYVYKKEGNYELALLHYKKAVEIDQKHKNLNIKATSFLRIATTYKLMKLHHESIKNYELSFKIFTELGDLKHMIKILNNIAENFIEVKYYDKAIESLQQGFKLANLLGNENLRSKIVSNISRLERILLNQNAY
ncbi:MAG: tetratricopeptide repeat protein [Promethearchaeota archaeon]